MGTVTSLHSAHRGPTGAPPPGAAFCRRLAEPGVRLFLAARSLRGETTSRVLAARACPHCACSPHRGEGVHSASRRSQPPTAPAATPHRRPNGDSVQQKVGRNILNRPRLPVPMYLPTCLLCDECTHTYAHTHTRAHTRTHTHTLTHRPQCPRPDTAPCLAHAHVLSLSRALSVSLPLHPSPSLPPSPPLRPIGLSAHSLVCCQPRPPTRCLPIVHNPPATVTLESPPRHADRPCMQMQPAIPTRASPPESPHPVRLTHRYWH
jgi:hypothetical protein